MIDSKKFFCVVGVSGFVGFYIVWVVFDKGYCVNGILWNKDDVGKVFYFKVLFGGYWFSLFSGDMLKFEDFDVLFEGVDVVFIVCLILIYKGFLGIFVWEMDDE